MNNIKTKSSADKPDLVPRIRTNAHHRLAWGCSHYITGIHDHNENGSCLNINQYYVSI